MTAITRPRDFDELTDEQVVEQVRQGNDLALEHLLQRYQRFARAKARGYFLIGADADDVYQEGMIGLFKAIRDFRDDRQASFRAFAELCITRQIITAIKTATRQKHQPLNSYVSFYMPCGEDTNDRTAEEVLVGGDEKLDPEHQIISMEGINSLAGSLNEILSTLELQVLQLYVEGLSYVDIADRLSRHAKSIDNAIQRIKRKLDAHLQKRAEEELALEHAV